MDVYSALKVKGRVQQEASQGTTDDDLVKYPTLTTALTDGSVTKVGTGNVGTDTKPIKLVGGVPTAVAADLATASSVTDLTTRVGTAEGDIDNLQTADGQNVKLTGNQTIAGTKTFSATIGGSISGNAATATTATKLGTADVGSSVRPIYLDGGVPTAASADLATAGDLTTLAGRVTTAEGEIDTLQTADGQNVKLTGAQTITGAKTFSAAVTASAGVTLGTSGTIASGDTKAVTGGAVYGALQQIAGPMRFMGTLGTGGTITTLPAASADNTGHTYKVITAGTYQGLACKVGDTVISDGTAWNLIPSGDEPSGTVTNIATGTGLTGGPITTTGTISIDTDTVMTLGDAQTASGAKTFSSKITASAGVGLGSSGSIASGNGDAVTGGTVYTALTDGTVSKLGTSTVGDRLTPIFWRNGVPTACAIGVEAINVDMAVGTTQFTTSISTGASNRVRSTQLLDSDNNIILADINITPDDATYSNIITVERATSTEAVSWKLYAIYW